MEKTNLLKKIFTNIKNMPKKAKIISATILILLIIVVLIVVLIRIPKKQKYVA